MCSYDVIVIAKKERMRRACFPSVMSLKGRVFRDYVSLAVKKKDYVDGCVYLLGCYLFLYGILSLIFRYA